jgi:hypothetical protein
MELVILSTVAAVAILVAELRDLAAGKQFGRPATPAATPAVTSVTDLAPGSRVANEDSAATHPELDRAA